jgi:hypothetical protein
MTTNNGACLAPINSLKKSVLLRKTMTTSNRKKEKQKIFFQQNPKYLLRSNYFIFTQQSNDNTYQVNAS